MTTTSKAWQRYQELYFEFAELELTLDLCDMPISEDFWDKMDPLFSKAALAMAQLEAGAIANPDENRMVGHYWLRTPEVAPTAEIQTEIRDTLVEVRRFADGVHSGRIMGADGPFSQILLIGIGGSALGPQCVSKALGHPQHDRLRLYCLDNTDPDGISRVLASIASDLGRTLTIVISKSGATKETRNGMVEARAAYRRADLSFERHAVAVTQKGSALDLQAADEDWLARFPMWDWVGGRTSELSAVGLLPAALQGFDIDSMLSGARACDAATRERVLKRNPSGLLAAMWYLATDGRGAKDMVILPYKDRLEAFPRYLQQLIMESLGKEKDLAGRVVHQGITVYGNKGSTDQHAYVQQLREGIDNFWVTFIEVLEAQKNVPIMVEADVSSGDFLFGFLLGTRQALQEKGRASMTVSVRRMDAFALGVLIALYERAVGFYASMVNINAYHQPGVEAGKRAAGEVIQLRTKVLGHLRSSGDFMTVEQIAAAIGAADRLATVHQICVYLSANAHHRVERQAGRSLVEHKYRSW